jgi:hypothetical protein
MRRDGTTRATLRGMAGSIQPTEFHYRADTARGGRRLLLTAVFLLIASFVTGLWGIAALLDATWLHSNELPVGDNVGWGIGMLFLATLQGVSALLILFSRPSGTYLGLAVAVINIASHIGAIEAYPLVSVIAIGVNAAIIGVLLRYGPRG